jgi:hypothetical protein
VKADEEWSTGLEAALMATRREDLQHGMHAAYVQGLRLKRVSGASASGWVGTRASSGK